MMRILFVVPYTPSLIRIRPYNLIRHLSARGHEVTVLTVTHDEGELASAEALAAHCAHVVTVSVPKWRSLANCLQALPTATPLQAVYSWEPRLLRRLAGNGNGKPPARFDAIHIEHLRGAKYGLELQALGYPRQAMVWDSVDCISHLFRQAAQYSQSGFGSWIRRLELGRTEQFEARLLSSFGHTLTSSEMDRQALQALALDERAGPISVIPNGVDLDYFKPDYHRPRDNATILFSGKMSYHANVTMALHLVEQIMPRVWAQRPDVQVTIVGKDPTREVQALAQNPAVHVTGTVPTVPPYLQTATLAVVPMVYGAGIQNKVLEAMACGTPVVTTSLAAAPLRATRDQDLLVADSAAAFAEAILALLADRTKRETLGAAGRSYVEEHHNWITIAGQLERIYEGVQEFARVPV